MSTGLFLLIFAVGLVYGVAITVAARSVLSRRSEAVTQARGLLSGLEVIRTRVEKAESRAWSVCLSRDARGENEEIAVNTVFAHRIATVRSRNR